MQPFAAMIAAIALGHLSISSTMRSLVGVCSQVRVMADHNSFGVPIENLRVGWQVAGADDMIDDALLQVVEE
eukprot:7390035-Prymnesium_polylepis.1